jgi:hypothetical protein
MLRTLGRTSLVKSLEKAVNTAFLKAGVKPVDIAGPVVHTDLMWQNPPLLNTIAKLNGVHLFEYLDYSMAIDPNQLYDFWQRALYLMYHNCHRIVDVKDKGLVGAKKLFNPAVCGQRRFRLSIPEGYPEKIDAYAGAMFSLEVAHLASLSTMLELTRDENNYYVTLEDGRLMGVKNGVPVISDPWDTSIAGAVWEFLEMPRGQITTTCLYDPIAKLRSVLWERKADFRDEFQAVDWALQALRSLSDLGVPCHILRSSAALPPPAMSRAHFGAALQRCLQTMDRAEVPDRSKLSMLYAELVPNIMSETQFRNRVYNLDKPVPFSLSQLVYDKIKKNLRGELEKLPPNERGA